MKKYSSGLVEESFWFIEFKKFIKLRVEGNSWDEIKRLCLEENLLGIAKEYRVTRIFGYLKNRVSAINEDMLKIFLSSDLSTQKIIMLIAIAKSNRLFFEFLYEEYREKCVLGINELKPNDISIFFKKKCEQSEVIANWQEATLKRLGSTYMNFLVNSGLITIINKQKKTTPPILDIRLERFLEDSGEMNMVKAIKGVN